MKTGQFSALCVRAALAAFVFTSAAQAQIMWQRSSDWIPGTPGSVSGTPGPSGPPTWVYEYTSGGSSLISQTPWYTTQTQMMVWDANWWGTNVGVWAAGDDISPPVDPSRFAHNVAAAGYQNVPLVRFQNPAGIAVAFSVSGTLKIVWDGLNGLGYPTPVDVIIAKQDASKSNTELLYSNTVSKPNSFPSVGDFVTLPVNLSNVVLGVGESLVVSHRARQTVSPGGWIHMHDNLTVIPAPGVAGVLGLSALACIRRRRR